MSEAGSLNEAGQKRWRRGDQVLWTYTNPAHPGLYDQRPVTVIADDEKHLAVWLESGTRMLHHVLDIVVESDGTFALKDADELEFAREAGMFADEKVARIRAAADSAIEDLCAWTFPFDSVYPDFQPDPDWPMPGLPAEPTWDFDAS